MKKLIKTVLGDTRGTAGVELGAIFALISVAILGALTGLTEGVVSSYNDTAAKVAQASR